MIRSSRWADPRLWLIGVFLFSALFFSRAYKTHVTLYSIGDDDAYWAYGRRAVYEGNFDFSKEPLPTFQLAEPPKQVGSPFPGLLWTPAIILGKALTPLIAHLPNVSTEALEHGITSYHRLLISAYSACLTLVGMFFYYFAFRRLVDQDAVARAVLVAVLGSPLLYFTFRRPLMSHSAEFFTVALLIWTSLRFVEKPTPTASLFFGFSAALAAATRYPNVFVVLGWCAGLWYWNRERLSESLSTWWPTILGAAIILGIQLHIWRAMGSGGMPASGDYSFMPEALLKHFAISPRTLIRSFEVFFGGWGLAWMEPAFLLAAVGMSKPTHQLKALRTALTLAIIPLFLITANYWRGTQGGSYGYRYFLGKSPWIILGLALFLDRYKNHWRTWIFAALFFPLVALTLFESGPENLTLHVTAMDWENSSYAWEAVKTLIAQPQQLAFALMGSPFFHSLAAGAEHLGLFAKLQGHARDVLSARLQSISLAELFWYYGCIFIFSATVTAGAFRFSRRDNRPSATIIDRP